ncbi:MAG: branched-chain amino acid aminotransferase [Myxococcales bacterium]|nr:MAG: branched-chain amino acid aminotransferase [Myxococcales bacterium]
MQITIRSVPEAQKRNPKEVLSKPLGFGRVFADRMFRMRWNEKKSWHDAEICAYEPLVLDPAALIFHYAQEIFEGLKAYRLPDGGVGLFRPKLNAERMNASARRLVMPEIPVEAQMQALTMLLRELKDWAPSAEGSSLYIRPTMIGVTPVLGVRPASDYLYYIICSPVSGYFEKGFAPVKVATSEEYVRAAAGGLGASKAGANYAASLLAAKVAKTKGYDQVVWLDAKEHRFIEEMGGMNIFFVYGKQLLTSPLTGSILPGITRDSILKLAPEMDLEVEECRLSVDKVTRDINSGKITEIFACGTAAVVTAVSIFSHKGTDCQVGNGEPGPVTTRLYNQLTGIQTGKLADTHGWTFRVL